MKHSRGIVLLLLLASLYFTGTASGQVCGDCITWSDTGRLKWRDFYAMPQPETHRFYDFSIELTYDYHQDTSGAYVFNVHCCFQPGASWRMDEYVRPYMLEHIQGNFDIDELYARKLKQELCRYAATSGKLNRGKIKWLYNKNEEDRLAFNALYDIETNHGYYFKDQDAWNTKIAEMLGGLSQYASR